MAGPCEGRVAIVAGAGRGLGRAHALELARQGASRDLLAKAAPNANFSGTVDDLEDAR